MDARRRTRTRTAAVVAAGALVVTGGVVAADLAAAPGAAAATLEPFGSCEELLGWYRDAAAEQVGPYGLGEGGPVAVAEAAETMAGADTAADAGAARTGEAVGSSSTGTNVQEAGVDEPSPLKVTGPDGRWAVALAGEDLVVVDTDRGEVAGRVRLAPDDSAGAGPAAAGADDPAGLSLPAPEPTAWFSDLLLVGDRVVVLGSASLPEEEDQGDAADGPGAAGPGRVADAVWWPASTPTTTATTVDVSDPADPRVVDVVEVEGSYVAARASEGTTRLVTTTAPALRFTDPWQVMQEPGAPEDVRTPRRDGSPSDEALAEAEARNRAVVEEADLAAWLPDLVERDDAGAVTARRPVACEDVAHPVDGPAGLGTIGVLTLDPAAGAGSVLLDTTAVSADGSYVHATADRLYVATTRGGWLWGWPWAGGPGRTEPVRTQLHGFDTSDPRDTAYLGSGQVEGWLLGQWAMDAHDGTLRVGTTLEAPGPDEAPPGPSGAPAPPRTTSSVVVLTETGDGLVETGRVDGLGPGEQIRSLRWFDDLAVVVTFEQTDPLYTVDLADPARPRVLGELKVTGYSGYLHPVGDGLLLGVGQEGDQEGVLSGAKVETYDLRDLAAPTDVDRLVWPDSASPVEQDSRRFAYLPDLRTAVVPLDTWAGGDGSSGLVAVAVDPAGGLTESGRWDGERAGYLSALAAAGDQVLVTVERWDGDGDGGATRGLTVLDARTLEPVTDVDLG
ncbi:beta-propeller domain-containing protein [Aquipuribacter sp. SD81]|uniref:beta-propeller domain-containing protein n=1 Tax=Aquipuribacter sp. SD81 TaxID=3127703 RepID=UPI003017A25F